MEEDDDGWVPAARENPALVARVLLSFSPPEPPLMWGAHKPRSRKITWSGIEVAKRGEPEAGKRRGSPTTPLSWSGGSATSGSVCGQEVGGESSLAPAKKKLRPATGGGSMSKESVVAVTESTPLPLGCRLSVPNEKTIRRPAKRKSISELQEVCNSLLREKMELCKELDTLQMNKRQLTEVNTWLNKRLKLSFQTKTMPKQEKGLPSNLQYWKVNTMSTDSFVSEEMKPEQFQCMFSSAVQVPNAIAAPLKQICVIDLNQLPVDD